MRDVQTAPLTKEVLGKMYNTTAGAMLKLGFKHASTLSREIRKKKMRVFRYLGENLFLDEFLEEWVLKNTSKVK